LAADLGQVCHWLHLLAGVGMRPPDTTLAAACTYLKQHESSLSAKHLWRLQECFMAWGYSEHGLGPKLAKARPPPADAAAGTATAAAASQ